MTQSGYERSTFEFLDTAGRNEPSEPAYHDDAITQKTGVYHNSSLFN